MATTKSTHSTLSAEQLEALRDRCKRDLYFFAKEILGFKDLVPHVHQQICDCYVKKDPSKGIFDQSDVKTRMVLAPRGCFKTTIDIADICQWIITFPNVRILILTGSQDLAWRMVQSVKKQFQTNDYLRQLFPEFCPAKTAKWGTDDEFTTPARTDHTLREPTVSSSTIASVKAGSHFEVIAADDIQNEINSATPEQCQKVIESYDGLEYLLEPGGFINVNGTRYQSWDLYGKLIQRDIDAKNAALLDAEEGEEGEDPPLLKTTILAAWTLKPGIKLVKDDNGRYIIRKSDVDLLFPERLKFRDLRKKFIANPRAFCCQMLNNPESAQDAERPFTSALIESHCIPYTQLPFPNACRDFILWDLAGANTKTKVRSDRDYVVGVVGRMDPDGKLFIIDMARGHWNATQQAAQIVMMAKNYPSVEYTWIEDSQGSRYLEPTIYNIAAQSKVGVAIRWVEIPRFGGAKRFRIDALADFFKSDRLWIAAHLPHIDALKAELLDTNPAHDDCADAVALMVRELGMRPSFDHVEEVTTPSLKQYHAQLFERALFGDDDDVPRSIVEPVVVEQTPQTFKAGILGYGLLH